MKIHLVFACAMLVFVTLISASCDGRVPVTTLDIQTTAPAENTVSPKHPGKLICGVVENEPMTYIADGVWTGFDVEFARLVGEKLDLEVEFQMLKWERRFFELDSGLIDAIWCGFNGASSENGKLGIRFCDMSFSYMQNTQCVVVKRERLGEFSSAKDLAGKALAVEIGSSGEAYAEALAGEAGITKGVDAQADTFLEVKTGAVDCAIVDVVLAKKIAGTGGYTDLTMAFALETEVYAVGFKTGDNLRNKVNTVMKELFDDGTLLEIAKKYGIDERLVFDTTFGLDDCDC